jgi:hypothetical protein
MHLIKVIELPQIVAKVRNKNDETENLFSDLLPLFCSGGLVLTQKGPFIYFAFMFPRFADQANNKRVSSLSFYCPWTERKQAMRERERERERERGLAKRCIKVEGAR